MARECRLTMNLRYRRFQPGDTTDCLRLMQTYPEYSPQLLAELPLLWKRLFDEQAMIAAVIEDCEPGKHASIVGFGADVFVTDAFMGEARGGREPYLSARLVLDANCLQHHQSCAGRASLAPMRAED